MFFAPKTVDEAIAGLSSALGHLNDLEQKHLEDAADKRERAQALHAEADEHEKESGRALRIRAKIRELIS